ncbi:MAG TPA: hypothetical protein VHM64_23785, partial [Candidatus Binatia bacterium]|nr:hypothetical protein [Candidatus Binatia bacterium]
FYNTRHTYISVALSHNVNIKWIAEQCGTSVEMTRAATMANSSVMMATRPYGRSWREKPNLRRNREGD